MPKKEDEFSTAACKNVRQMGGMRGEPVWRNEGIKYKKFNQYEENLLLPLRGPTIHIHRGPKDKMQRGATQGAMDSLQQETPFADNAPSILLIPSSTNAITSARPRAKKARMGASQRGRGGGSTCFYRCCHARKSGCARTLDREEVE